MSTPQNRSIGRTQSANVPFQRTTSTPQSSVAPRHAAKPSSARSVQSAISKARKSAR